MGPAISFAQDKAGRRCVAGSGHTYAKYVGRVGALAVALGIGAAMASTPGVAWAEGPDGTADASTQNDNDTAQEPNTPAAAVPSAQAPDLGDVLHQGLERTAGNLRKIVAGVVRSSGGAHTSTPRSSSAGASGGNILPNVEDTGIPTPGDPAANTPLPSSLNQRSAQRGQHEAATYSAPPVLRQVTRAVTDVATRTRPNIADPNVTPRGINAPDPALIVANLTEPPRLSVRGLNRPVAQMAGAPAQPSPVTRVVTGLLSAIGFGPAANDGRPVAPASGPTLLGALGLIRRELEHLFDNKSPDVAATPTSLTVRPGKATTFTLPATDADGDRLTYTVADGPDHGTLSNPTYNSTTQTYTYTYTAAQNAPVGSQVDDQFTLIASDAASGPHIHGLANLFNPQGAHTDPVTVTVDSTAANAAPEVRQQPSVGTPYASTGAVSGTLGVVDPDGDPLTYTLAPGQGPQNGTVTFDPTTGTYTYTPTQAARITAGEATPQTFARSSFARAAAAVPSQDSFTVLVSDGTSSTPVTVTVPISPAKYTVANPITVGEYPDTVAISPDGRRVYVVNNVAGTVSIIDPATNTVVGAPISLGGRPSGIAITPDGKKLYVANGGDQQGENAYVSVIDTTTRSVSTIPFTSQPTDVALSPDGTRLYVTSQSPTGGIVTVINTGTNTAVGTPYAVGRYPMRVAVSRDGTRLAVANQGDNTVSILNAATGASIGTPVHVGSGPTGLTFNTNGTRVYVANQNDGTVSVIDTTTGAVAGDAIPVGANPVSLALSPDGSLAYVTRQVYNDDVQFGGNTVVVIDTATGAVIGNPIEVGTGPLDVAVNADGTRIYVTNASDGSAPGTVSVISLVATQPPPAVGDPTPVGTTNPSTGASSFTVVVPAKTDGSAPTFTATQPAGVNGTITTGTPVRNQDGTYTYTVTYTPAPQDRVDAYSTPGPDQVTLTVAVDNGSGTVATREVPVTITPVLAAVTASTSAPYVNGGRNTVGTDGTFVQSIRTGAGTAADPYKTTVTVLRPGEAAISQTTVGDNLGSPPQVAADGTVTFTTRTGTGTTSDPYKSTVTVLRPGQAAVTSTVIANNGYALVGADGTVAFVTQTGAGTAADPRRTTVTVLRPNQPTTSTSITSAPNFSPSVTVGSNGTVAFSSITGVGTVSDPYRSTLTIMRPGEAPTASTANGVSIAPKVGDDGTVVQVIQTGTGSTTDPYKSTVIVARPGMSQTSEIVTGRPSQFSVGADGTVAVLSQTGTGTTSDPYKYTETVMRRGQPATSTFLGSGSSATVAPTVGADGTVAQSIRTGTGTVSDPYKTVTTVLRNGEAPQSTSVTSNVFWAPVVGADGTVAQTTQVGSGTSSDPYQTTLTIMRRGQATTSTTIAGSYVGVAGVGADGTVAQITSTGNALTATISRPGQPTTTTVVQGRLEGNPPAVAQVATDGTVALMTTSASTGTWQNTITLFRSGEPPTTLTVEGFPVTQPTFDAQGNLNMTVLTNSPATGPVYTTAHIAVARTNTGAVAA